MARVGQWVVLENKEQKNSVVISPQGQAFSSKPLRQHFYGSQEDAVKHFEQEGFEQVDYEPYQEDPRD